LRHVAQVAAVAAVHGHALAACDEAGDGVGRCRPAAAASVVSSESMPTTSTPPARLPRFGARAVQQHAVFVGRGSAGRSRFSMLRSEYSSLPTTSNSASAPLKPSCSASVSRSSAVRPSRCSSFSTSSRPRAMVCACAWVLNQARTLARERGLAR
jgi:hypothetical protein